MSKFYLSTLLTAAFVVIGGGYAEAQEDYTSKLTNPDFEGTYGALANSGVNSDRAIYQPEGWTAAYTKGNGYDMTALTLDDASATTFVSNSKELITIPSTGYGNHTYRVRLFPKSKGNVKLSQTVNLPAGVYTFSASTAGINSAKINVFAGGTSGKVDSKGTGTFSESTVTFYVYTQSDVNVGINVTASGTDDNKKAVAYIDNCKLTYTPFSYANQSGDLLTNGSFDSNKGWTFTEMTQNTDKKSRPTAFYEKWVTSTSNLSNVTASATQTVTSLPAGVYVLKGTVNAQLQSNSNTEITGVTLDINGQSVNCSGSWKDYELVYKLETAGDITVAFKSENSNANWVAVDEFSLKYAGTDYNQVVADKNKADYETALAEAKSAQGNTSYTNVVGSEKTDLDKAISDYGDDKTISDYPTATSALTSATETFIKAKDAYDELVSVQKLLPESLTYADATKVSEAKTAAEYKATSADDATTYLATAKEKIRAAVESNGIAEGISGATEILTYDFKDNTVDSKNKKVGEWTYYQTGGELNVKKQGDKSWEPWTGSDGDSIHSYFNYYNGTNDNQTAQYAIDLAAGKYILTVKSRAQTTLTTNLAAIGTGTSMSLSEINNTGGVFGNGWNDYTLEFVSEAKNINLKWYCTQKTAGKGGWSSFGDVRLYRIADRATVTSAGYATYAAPDKVDYSKSTGLTAYTAAYADGKVTLTEITGAVPANTPVVLKANEGTYDVTLTSTERTVTGNGLKVSGEAVASDGTQYCLTTLTDNGNTVVGFAKVKSGVEIPAGKAYLEISQTNAKSFIAIGEGEATGINSIAAESLGDGNVYNVAGQKVNGSYKGIVIKNGKKYIRK